MDEHRRELVQRLLVVLPELLELCLQPRGALALAFELRDDEALLGLEPRDEVGVRARDLDRILLREKVRACAESGREWRVLCVLSIIA